MLVCKKWNELANETWNCEYLFVDSKNLRILDFNRNKRVKDLCIKNGNGLNAKLLGILSTLFNLESLSLIIEEPYNRPRDFGKVFDDDTENNICDDLYSSVFSNLQSLKIDSSVIPVKQIVKILSFVCKSKKLKSLKLPCWKKHYDEIPESLFIEVLRNLACLELNDHDQIFKKDMVQKHIHFMEEAIKIINTGETKLNSLELTNVDMSAIDSKTFANALNSLENLKLYTNVSRDQSNLFFKEITRQQTKLKSLRLSGMEVDHVHCTTLAKALNCIQFKNL